MTSSAGIKPYAGRRLRIWALLGIATVLTGCGGYVPHILVIRGNYNVSRGQYQNAVVDYLRASDNSDYDDWVSYNLGNVYHALGENTGAEEMWETALESDTVDLIFGAAYNRGVYLYELGRYQEALQQFRLALKVAPRSLVAKRNFELALEKIEAEQDLREEAETQTGKKPVSEQSGNRVLDYVGRKEEQRWRANAERAIDPSVQDW